MGLILDGTSGISASGNITGGNVVVTNNFLPNNVLTAGNITGGNLITSGRITATGNITGGNISVTKCNICLFAKNIQTASNCNRASGNSCVESYGSASSGGDF